MSQRKWKLRYEGNGWVLATQSNGRGGSEGFRFNREYLESVMSLGVAVEMFDIVVDRRDSEATIRRMCVAAFDAFVSSIAGELPQRMAPRPFGIDCDCDGCGSASAARATTGERLSLCGRCDTERQVEKLARAVFDRRLLAEALRHAEDDGPRARVVLDKMWTTTKASERATALDEAAEIVAMRSCRR